MQRITASTLLLPLALVLASCQSEMPVEGAPLDAFSNPNATRGQPAQELPFEGRGSAEITRVQYAPGFPGGRSTFDGRCSVPADLVYEFTGTGQVRHLGKVSVVFEHCSRLDFTTGQATFDDGVFIFTAANGDQLWGTHGNGTGVPVSATEVRWEDTFVLDGGTGRFANAWGGGANWGTTHMETGHTRWNTQGAIVYDASNRGDE